LIKVVRDEAESFTPIANIPQALKNIEKYYNHRLSRMKKVYLETDWNKYQDKNFNLIENRIAKK